MPSLSWWVLCGATLLLLGVSLAYLRRYRVTRPPVGVLNRADMLSAVLIITLAHVLYVILPLWIAVGLFTLAVLGALYCALEPLFSWRWLVWLVGDVLIACDIGAVITVGVQDNRFLLVNDVVILLVIIGVSQLWMQSGLRARDAVLFSLLLAIFDLLATSLSPLTFTLFARLQGAPLTPALAWDSHGTLLGGGLGDFLLVTVFTLTMEKAYGRAAGISSGAVSLVMIAVLLIIDQPWPGMVFLAPLMVGQYLFWRHRSPHERTMQEYLQQVPS